MLWLSAISFKYKCQNFEGASAPPSTHLSTALVYMTALFGLLSFCVCFNHYVSAKCLHNTFPGLQIITASKHVQRGASFYLHCQTMAFTRPSRRQVAKEKAKQLKGRFKLSVMPCVPSSHFPISLFPISHFSFPRSYF